MSLKDRLIDPRSPDRRPRRAAYALPTLFTAGNISSATFRSCVLSRRDAGRRRIGSGAAEHFATAANAIGVAVVSGRPGRPHRAHDEHHQRFRPRDGFAGRRDQLRHRARGAGIRLGRAVRRARSSASRCASRSSTPATSSRSCFCCAAPARLARFNVQKNPIPKNPGRPDRKYFVGLPIPAAAAMVAAVVYACDAQPLRWWPLSVAWLAAAGAARFPDGQHLALLQLQGHQPQQSRTRR